MGAKAFFKELGAFWKTIVIIVIPLAFMVWPIVIPTPEVKTAFVLIVMAVYWMTEVIPLAVTSLLPVFLFPMLGVMKAADVCPNYMKDTNMLFVGGLMMAVAVEKSNLHKRIALRVLLVVGGKPRWLMMGFMIPTWFLSMWISNTATTAMMVPIVEAVLVQLRDSPKKPDQPNGSPQYDNRGYVEDEKGLELHDGIKFKQDLQEKEPSGEKTVGEIDIAIESETDAGDVHHQKMCKAMCLCICYSASIGGISTLTGTGPNLVLKGQTDDLFKENGEINPVTFSSWMVAALPVSALSLFLGWLWLQTWFLGCCKKRDCCCAKDTASEEGAKEVIRQEYNALGPMKFDEIGVLIHFVLLALLWFLRHPEFIPGWDYIFPEDYLEDSTPAILIATSLFIFPAQRPNFFCFRAKDDKSKSGPRQALLDWKTAAARLPWGIVLLLGGGFALADGCRKSGLSQWVGEQLVVLQTLPNWVMVMLLTLITATATEATSNTATATILLPILAELSIKIGMNPLYLMFPACLATSFAFMLPVATPPNAIVFGYGHLKVRDMAAAGFMMNIVCVLIVTLAVETWAKAFFNLEVLPSGFKQANATNFNFTTTANPCITH